MNEPVSPQRRRPPGWRAARPDPDDREQDGPATDAPSPGEPLEDTAFNRGETVERPAVRLPVEEPDHDDDHPVFGGTGDRRDPDRDQVDHGYDDRYDRYDRDEDGYEDGYEDDDGTGDAHPVAVPLAGFFTGMAYVLVLPVLYVWLSDPDSIADSIGVDLAWLLAAVLVPVLLTAIPQTRKFGRYMLLGVGLSAVVVVGVAAVVLAVLIFLV